MKRFVALLLFTSCGWPIAPDKMPEVMKALKDDQASACIWMGLRGGAGGGALVPAPTVPMTGGYGSGEILIGRVNADNTSLTIDNGKCTISRGPPAAP